VYRVPGAVVRRKFLAYPRIFKHIQNRQKRASVHRRVGVKGLRKSYFTKIVDVLKMMRGDFQFFSKVNLETRIKEGSVGMLQRKLD
jgi:hypothetical protein